MSYGQYSAHGGKRLTVDTQMENIPHDERKRVGHNRVLFFREVEKNPQVKRVLKRLGQPHYNIVGLVLYTTVVAEYNRKEKVLWLNTGGWNTQTTRRGINDFKAHPPLKLPFVVYGAKKRNVLMIIRGGEYTFDRSIKVNCADTNNLIVIEIDGKPISK